MSSLVSRLRSFREHQRAEAQDKRLLVASQFQVRILEHPVCVL